MSNTKWDRICEVKHNYCLQGEVKNGINAVSPTPVANGRNTRVKIGEVFIVMDGMRVDPKLLTSSRSVAR